MTPTNKGNYLECSDCIYLIESKEKYNCSYSHKEVRLASGVKYERYFRECGLFKRKDSLK